MRLRSRPQTQLHDLLDSRLNWTLNHLSLVIWIAGFLCPLTSQSNPDLHRIRLLRPNVRLACMLAFCCTMHILPRFVVSISSDFVGIYYGKITTLPHPARSVPAGPTHLGNLPRWLKRIFASLAGLWAVEILIMSTHMNMGTRMNTSNTRVRRRCCPHDGLI